MNVAPDPSGPVPVPLRNVVLTGFAVGFVVNAKFPDISALITAPELAVTVIDPVCFSGNPPTI